jgi:hypothetical protein
MGLCASHIDTLSRYKALLKMLSSVVKQTLNIQVFVSISSNEHMESHIHKLCRVVNDMDQDKGKDKGKSWLTIKYRGPHKLTQFEHYCLLANEIYEIHDNNTWCIFSDDDDLWHPSRAQVYNTAIKREENNKVVACGNSRMSIWKGTENVSKTPGEYFDFAPHMDVFKGFCGIATDLGVNRLRGCDLIFRNYMRSMPCTVFSTMDALWLYQYNFDEHRGTELPSYLDEALTAWNLIVDKYGINTSLTDGYWINAIKEEYKAIGHCISSKILR